VHAWLITIPVLTHPWLTEGPRQLVNDFVASYSIVLMGRARVDLQPQDFWPSVSVQQLVFAETLGCGDGDLDFSNRQHAVLLRPLDPLE
jgi:hypothetical protein